jgi:hypothetical protein
MDEKKFNELIAFADGEIRRGIDPASVRSALLGLGWTTEDMDKVFAAVMPPPTRRRPEFVKPVRRDRGSLLWGVVSTVLSLLLLAAMLYGAWLLTRWLAPQIRIF